MTSSPIVQALAQMQVERDNLAARLEKVDGLIASMRDVFHLPKNGATVEQKRPSTKASAKKKSVASSNGNGHSTLEWPAIRDALASGPMRPGDLAAQLGVERSALRAKIKTLEADGVIVSSGTTMSRRVGLRHAKPAAKEAP